MKNETKNAVVIKLSKHAGAENSGELRAYVVNSGGKIIETAHFKGDEAVLTTPRKSLEGQSKIYLAPALPENSRIKKNERALLKMNAYEVVKNFNENLLTVGRLPSGIIDRFPFFDCLITGHVNKNFFIDGQSKNLPLCDLRVHICEVQAELVWPYIPIYYRRIPDWVLQEIAQKIVNLHFKPGPPDPIGPISFEQKVNLPLASLTTRAQAIRSAQSNLPPLLPGHVLNDLQSGSVDVIRKSLTDYHYLIYPYICLWRIYWPYIYCMEELAVVNTDCNGHFQQWELLFGKDHSLNIYIWVEANINGQWVTVYRPLLPCGTRWNYQCGTDINLTLTDPRLEPCNCGVEGPADAVWFRSIGQSAAAMHIEQNPTNSITIQGASFKNAGCTDIINGDRVSPFGSVLTFKLFCGANIFAAGATHYRWKYTMIADANQNPIPSGSQTTNILSGPVSRPYLVKLSATHYESRLAPLGAVGTAPDVAYHIPHQEISAEITAVIPAADQLLSPQWNDVFFDSASIDSHSLTDGLYRFDLELLRQDAAGAFHVVAVDRSTFQVSEYGDIGSSTNAPDNYMLPQNPLLAAVSLSFNARIDNAPCVGLINDAELKDTGAKSGSCGFIIYSDKTQDITLSFEASHPRNFAKFSYGVVKGDGSVATGINPGGYVISSVDGFTLAAGAFSNDFTVDSLLNGCPGQAAFSENLHVSSLATDGTSKLYSGDYYDTTTNAYINSYDAYSVGAFALSKT